MAGLPSGRTITKQALVTVATMFTLNQLAAQVPTVRNVIGGSNRGFFSRLFG